MNSNDSMTDSEPRQQPFEASGKTSELITRIITAVVMVLVVIGLFAYAGLSPEWGKPMLFCVATTVVSVAAQEAACIAGRRFGWKVGAVFGCVAILIFFWQLTRVLTGGAPFGEVVGREGLALGVLGGVVCAIPGLCARARSISEVEALVAAAAIQGILIITGGTLLISMVGGPALFFLTVASVAVNDTAAFFVGKYVGGFRLSPVTSPKKTWAGALGGLAAGSLTWILGAFLLPWVGGGGAMAVMPRLLEWWTPFVVIGGAQLSDITKSLLKRGVGQKDSGSLLPGHGGFLDRIDGLLGALLVMAVLSC